MKRDRRPEGINLSNSRWANYRPETSPFPPPELIQQTSVGALFFETAAAHAHKLCYRYRNHAEDIWERVTWGEAENQVLKTALFLRDIVGVKPGDRVGIMSSTRAEWLIADLALLSVGAVSTPIFQTQTPNEAGFIIWDAEIKHLFLENEEQLKKISELQSSPLTILDTEEKPGGKFDIRLKSITSFEECSIDSPAPLHSLPKILAAPTPDAEAAKSIKDFAAQIDRDSLASIVYTSGTTGIPKGVMQSHGNHLSMQDMIYSSGLVGDGHGVFLFLPLAHSFARAVCYTPLATGGDLIFPSVIDQKSSRFDAKRMFQDVKESAPGVFPSVPRLFEKVMTGIGAQASRGIKGKLLTWAMREYPKLRDAKKRGRLSGLASPFKYGFASELVKRVRTAAFGANLSHCISGGAPISLETLQFFDAIDVLILEGYGLTETCPALTANVPHAYRFGTVGRAFEGVELKIAEADGEILSRGPNMASGYLGRKKSTDEVWEADGWFHTGDIGEIDEDGYLKITDRKKDLIVNAGGKNIAPQLVEGKLKSSPYISQALVYGDRKPYLVALLTVEYDNVHRWAAEQKLSREGILESPQFRELLKKEIKTLTADLANYEHVQSFAVIAEDFSIENGLLTPSLKLKRKPIIEKYRELIEGLYKSTAA